MKLSTKLFVFVSLFAAIAAQELSAGCPGGICGRPTVTQQRNKKGTKKKVKRTGFSCANGQCWRK